MAALQISEEIFPAAGHLHVLPFHAANWIISHDNPPDSAVSSAVRQDDGLMGKTQCCLAPDRRFEGRELGGASNSHYFDVFEVIRQARVCHQRSVRGQCLSRCTAAIFWQATANRNSHSSDASYTQVFILCVDSGLQ